jgi:hypothetical protein
MVSGSEKQWMLLIFVVLGVLALFFIVAKPGSPASAKAEPLMGNNEVLVIPIQIERDRYGVAMVDMVNETLWVYELNSMGPAHNRLRLLAARSWQYDRLLKQYNTSEPKPEQVRMLLEEEGLGEQPKEQGKEKQEGSDVNASEVNVVEANEPGSDSLHQRETIK